MRSYLNIERSAFHRGEYVGYGGGAVWRIRQTLFGGWKWSAHVARDNSRPTLYADTLSTMSARLAKLSTDTSQTARSA